MNVGTLHAVIVLAVLAGVFAAFVRERVSPDVVALIAVAVLLGTGVLSTRDVLEVFSNSAPVTVACLFVLAAALERTGIIETVGRFTVRLAGRSPRRALATLMATVMPLSALVNNTPVVVVLTPVAIRLAHAVRVAPSRLLIPLSYATILGGTCTLVGTSTNILVDGVARSLGLAPFGMFEITLAGAVLAAAGFVYLLLLGPRLLPERRTLADLLPDPARRQFLAEVLVPHDSPLVGRSLAEARLSERNGVRVIDVIRGNTSLRRELPELALAAGDRVVLRSTSADVIGMQEAGRVQVGAERAVEPIRSERAAVREGIVGPRSRFVGMRIADLRLRRLYGVYVLAVHRQSAELLGNFDEVRLSFGDTLLLQGPPEGLRQLFDQQELLNLSQPPHKPLRRDKGPLAAAVLVLMLGLAQLEVLPIAALALIAATAVVALGCLEAEEAYAAIGWRVLVLIFGMLALGTAMERSGAAELLVGSLTGLVAGLSPVAVLSIVYLLSALLTEIVTNAAVGILLTPIAVGLAQQLGVDPRPFVVAVMFAASASFATPIGYHTNTFVYSAGGYRFTDFVRIGLPLNLMLWLIATFLIPRLWPL